EMVISGVIITALGLMVYNYGLKHDDLLTGRSYAFCFFVYAALFRSFANRSEIKTFFEMKPNFYHLAACAIPLVCQLVIQQSVQLLDIFNMKSLSTFENLSLIGISLIPVTVLELVKVFNRIRKSRK